MPYSTQSPHEHGRHLYSLGQLPSFNRELLRSLLCLTFSPLSVAGSKFSISYNQLFLMEILVTEDEGGTEAMWTVYVCSSSSETGTPKLWGCSVQCTSLSLVAAAFLGVLVL